MKKIIWGIIVIVVVIVIITVSKNSHPTKQFKVGVILPLTGGAAVSGEKLLNGIKLAQKELDPDEFTFIIEDDHTKSTDGVTAAKKLLEVDKVDTLVGLYIPEEVVAVSPLAKEKGVTIFSASFCADSFKELTNVFCGYPGAVDQLETVIPQMKKDGVKSIALVNTNDDFGISSRDAMVSLAPEGGYTVALNELVPFGTRDLKLAADKVINSKADGVFMASGDPSQAFTLMKLLLERKFKGVRVTFIDIDRKAVADFSSAVEGVYSPGIAPNTFGKEFTDKYTAEYGKAPEDYVVALGYDIAHAATAVKGDPVKAVDYQYTNPAISGFDYKADHSINFGLELWKVEKGEYVTVK